MKPKTKKILKRISIVLGILILVAIIALGVMVYMLYTSVYHPIPYTEREDSYSMPDLPDSGLEDIDQSEYDDLDTDDDDDDDDFFDDQDEESDSDDPKSETSKKPGGSSSSGTSVPKDTPIYIIKPIDENILNVLLVGRDVVKSEGGRSDTMMVLSYNKTTGEIVLTSFLRDILVPIEKYGWNRINAAYRFGNVGLTVNTINEVFDLDIQHYISVDFSGFTAIINKIGGVDVELTQEEVNHLAGQGVKNLSAGTNHLNGSDALKFARIRKLAGGDFNRTERQRRLMTALIKQVTKDYTAPEAIPLIYEGVEYLKTNLSISELISLTYDFFSKSNVNIDGYAIPANGTYSFARYNGKSVLKIDFKKNTDLIKDRIYNSK